MTTGHTLRRTDDLPDPLHALLEAAAVGAAITQTAVRCGDGWHVDEQRMQRLRDAVGKVLDGQEAA